MSDSVAAALRAPAAHRLHHDEPLNLPDAWAPPPRPPVPVLAAIVPVVGAVAIWLVTGSVLALWLAVLGPLLAGASVLDAGRTTRRDRRRAERAAREAHEAAYEEIVRRHGIERAERRGRHPDVAGFIRADAEVWRSVPGRAGVIVVGSGDVVSEVQVNGGHGDPAAARLRRTAARLADAPVVVSAALGVTVIGSGEVACAAVLRGLALQLCLALPPGELRITGPLRGVHAWAEELPHRRAASGRALALIDAGDPVPADAEFVLALGQPGLPASPRCGVTIHVRGLTAGRLDEPSDADERDLRLEAVGEAQALELAAQLDRRAGTAFGRSEGIEPLPLGRLLADHRPVRAPGRLPAVIGVADTGPLTVDLVADGPHAVVAGVTGAGKSELLITWILSLCATHSTRELSFLLADFKGGTAFDALTGLAHVTGVLTDLDGSGARRAIESLRAEMRWREGALAAAGARDVADPRVQLPRLVIVVDEFAALLSEQPELHAVFADVAARGRALGMHLILGTQRIAGVVREVLLANCPLRLSLRVTDRADSRAVIGSEDAADIPGGDDGRGIAMVRRAADALPLRVRVALSAAADVAAVIEASTGPQPRRPWLPELPACIDLAELPAVDATPGALVLGLLDEPEWQRQAPACIAVAERGLLVAGGPGSGRTTALDTLAAQARHVVRIPDDAESAWDAAIELQRTPPGAGSLVVADDLDALMGRFPPEYAQEFFELLDALCRGAGQQGYLVAASVQRLSGPVVRIADLLPRRLVLRTTTRLEHIALGGDPVAFRGDAPPGRGTLDGVPIQIARVPEVRRLPREDEAAWMPSTMLTGFVARRSPAAREAQRTWQQCGMHVWSVAEYAEGVHPGTPTVVVGDPEEWQRHWRVLSQVRSEHDLVIDASCAADLRLLTGSRILPPYAEPGRGRAWLFSSGDDPVRIVLPAVQFRSIRTGTGS
ncbi:FtsK/SpoIIIE domain-containing protein [Microbacterium sp. Marseille-Q6648]|uniref:FtsK/SpoIIIE domain-containing protein n=1 Tax=Microbacterium sp. Marseille-Q6648 TaxID=2937991 RepID=UPI002040D933|nr:FtsK/SpoIIIE domain-containing protein [Microbacterium sp. Marseille-Q6648]